MPGIFGIASARDARPASAGLPLLTARLRPHAGLRLHQAAAPDGRAILGTIDLGVLRENGTVHVAADGSMAVLHGEIVGPRDANLAELLEEYRRDPRCPTRWRGSFVVAIWDAAAGALVLTNDRFGLRNLYYAIVGDTLAFAPLASPLLAIPGVRPDLDLGAAADLLAFHHVLGERTLLQAVHMLPPGSWARFDGRGLHLERYWRPRYRGGNGGSPRDYAEELGQRLGTAVSSMLSGEGRPGIPLSGGLDSRAIVSACAIRPFEIPCFTYGIPGSDDLRIGSRIASLIGAPHHAFELRPGFIAERARQLVTLTDGMHLALNVHATVLQDCARWCDVILLGNGGDSLFDGFWKWPEAPPQSAAYVRRIFGRMNVGLDHVLAADVLRPAVLDEFVDGPKARLRERLAEYPGSSAADAADAFNVAERHWRWTLQGVPAQTTHVEFREPFYDYAVADLALEVPAHLRAGRRLHIETIHRHAPALGAIARQGTGQPPRIPAHHPRITYWLDRGRAGVRKLRRGLWGARVPPTQRLDGFADYGYELRGGSESLLRDVVLDPRALDRGWYRPEGLRRLVDDHLACRANHTGVLGPILTLELWLQQVVDVT